MVTDTVMLLYDDIQLLEKEIALTRVALATLDANEGALAYGDRHGGFQPGQTSAPAKGSNSEQTPNAAYFVTLNQASSLTSSSGSAQARASSPAVCPPRLVYAFFTVFRC